LPRPSAPGAWRGVSRARFPAEARHCDQGVQRQFTERFTREAHAIAALNHTNICHLYDFGRDYLVMEYHMTERRHSCAGEMI